MACPNRIDDAYDNEGPRCGDEGRVCSVCAAKEAATWADYFGLRPDMTREQRRAQMAAFAPPGRSDEEVCRG
jgi:hypothetical protein